MHFKYENLKNYAPFNIAYCASARLGVPLLFGANFIMIENIENEIWKDIPTQEGIYQISNYSRVKVLARIRSNGHKWKEHLLKPYLSNKGYYTVNLPKAGKQQYQPTLIHRLVAQAFIPNPKNRTYINHKNEIKTDNNISNLEWCTNRYNISYSTINKPKTSEYIGVYWSKPKNRWRAEIRYNDKKYFLGLFKIEIDAHKAYQLALQQIDNNSFIYTKKKTASQYKGVSWNSRDKKWLASIIRNKKQIRIGTFRCEIDAHLAYQTYISQQ
jgi:hypothetical protein